MERPAGTTIAGLFSLKTFCGLGQVKIELL